MATITLDYFIVSTSVPLARLLARAQAADLFKGELDLLGFSLTSYVASIVTNSVRGRVILASTPTSDERFPTTASQIYATKNLYRAALADQIPAQVTSVDPVVT